MQLSKIMQHEVTMGILSGGYFVALFVGLIYMTVVIITHASGKYETVRFIYPANNVECVIVSRGARSDVECWSTKGEE